MQQLWPVGQQVSGGSGPDEGALARLADPEVACVQHSKADLQGQAFDSFKLSGLILMASSQGQRSSIMACSGKYLTKPETASLMRLQIASMPLTRQ